MIRKSFLLFIIFLLPSSVFAQSSADFVTTSGKDLRYRGQTIFLRGTNFANVLALKARVGPNGDWIWGPNVTINDVPITEADYQKLSELGGNHARFGMSFSWWRENKTKFYQVMDTQVNWARKYNVWIVLNMFTTPGDCYEGYSNYCGIWTNSSEQQQFIDFWVDVANHYKNEPVIAGFDLLNEPTPPGPGWASTWYTFAQRIITAIRAVDTNHLIMVESTSDPTFGTKFTGGNIVYEVHDYLPMGMSHCVYSGNATYPGNAADWDGTSIYWSKDSMGPNGSQKSSLKYRLPIDWATQNSVPVYIGEWGPSGSCLNGYIQYIQDRGDLYKTYGISQAHYTWRNGESHWGLFPDSGALVAYNQERVNAVKSGWSGSARPNFSGTTTNPTVTPTQGTQQPTLTRTPTPSRTPTTTPTRTPTPRPGTPTPTSPNNQSSIIPNAPAWFFDMTETLQNFLEQLYLTVYYFKLPSNMSNLLDGLVN